MSNAGFGRSFLGGLVVTVVLAMVALGMIIVDVVDTWVPVPGAVAFGPQTGRWSDAPEPPLASAPDPAEYPELPGDELEIRVFDDGTAIAVPSVSASSVHWYDGQRWRVLGPVEQPLELPGADRLTDGRVVVAGLGGTLVLDPERGTVTPFPAPPADCWEGRLVAAGDRVYAVVDHEGIHHVALLVPEAGSWTTLPLGPGQRQGAELHGLDDGSLVLVGGWGAGQTVRPKGVAWMVFFAVAVGAVAWSSVRAIRRGVHWGGAILGAVLGVGFLLLGGFILLVLGGGAHGRPLRLGPRVVRGRVRGGVRGGSARQAGQALPWATRWLLGRAWSRDAALEHASVRAFEQLAQQLEAVDAPPELVARARQAATEETEHARLCLGLASRHARRELTLAPLPELPNTVASIDGRDREATIVRIAVESLVDGVIGEGWAAAAAQRAQQETTDVQTLHALEVIARDEASHAAHARDVLTWCLAEGGERTRAAVRRATRRERGRVRSRGLPMTSWMLPTRSTDLLAHYGRFREARPGALDAELRAALPD